MGVEKNGEGFQGLAGPGGKINHYPKRKNGNEGKIPSRQIKNLTNSRLKRWWENVKS